LEDFQSIQVIKGGRYVNRKSSAFSRNANHKIVDTKHNWYFNLSYGFPNRYYSCIHKLVQIRDETESIYPHPDRPLALLVNFGFVAHIRHQMESDISKITDTNIQNAHWAGGCVTSLLGWGIAIVAVIVIGFLESFIPGTSSYSYNKGLYYADKGDYESAITSYNTAIELNPEDVYSYNNRGLVYIDLGNYDKAIVDFNKAIDLDPNYDKAYFNRALAYEELRRVNEARQDFEKAIELTTDPTIRAYAEKELIKLKTIDNSIDNDSVSHYNSGEKYYEGGNFDQAIVEFTKTIELNPNYIDAYQYRAIAYVQLREYDLALADLDKAISLNPDDAYLFHVRGVFYKEIGDFDRALADQNKAIDLDPQYVDAYLERGISYGSKGDYDNALADFNKAIELDPSYALPYNSRGYTYFLLSDYESALVDFNKAIKFDPNIIEAYQNRGALYGITGDHNRAVADFNKVIELNPNDALAYFNRGLSYKFLGEISDAIKDFEHVLEISTDPELSKSTEEELKSLRR
jgi:tetratricopeptide (TPR) repeat protein